MKVQKIHQIHNFISKADITPAIYNGLHWFVSLHCNNSDTYSKTCLLQAN